jgi:DNA-directed RNA polymerase specialized sigma24 family protein
VELFNDDSQYRHLLRALRMFCRANGSAEPEDDASEAIARLVAKAGAGVRIENVEAYAIVIARNVLYEKQRERMAAFDGRPISLVAAPSEALLRCLEGCKRKHLSAKERKIIKAYYQGESGQRISNRARLAKKLGISPDALKISAYRIRRKLEQCALDCREKDAPLTTDSLIFQIENEDRKR